MSPSPGRRYVVDSIWFDIYKFSFRSARTMISLIGFVRVTGLILPDFSRFMLIIVRTIYAKIWQTEVLLDLAHGKFAHRVQLRFADRLLFNYTFRCRTDAIELLCEIVI